MKYNVVHQFVKNGSLLDYFQVKSGEMHFVSEAQYDRQRELYARERSISLYAMVRFDRNKQTAYCKIKCPVNPLPIKGEFELANERVLCQFLENLGWRYTQKIVLDMFE